MHLGENGKLIAIFKLRFQRSEIYLTEPLNEICFEIQMLKNVCFSKCNFEILEKYLKEVRF